MHRCGYFALKQQGSWQALARIGETAVAAVVVAAAAAAAVAVASRVVVLENELDHDSNRVAMQAHRTAAAVDAKVPNLSEHQHGRQAAQRRPRA